MAESCDGSVERIGLSYRSKATAVSNYEEGEKRESGEVRQRIRNAGDY